MTFEDEFDDDEWVDDDDEESECLECPLCRAQVHEDTQQCPQCGDWITPVYPRTGASGWIWKAAAILVILAMLLVVLG